MRKNINQTSVTTLPPSPTPKAKKEGGKYPNRVMREWKKKMKKENWEIEPIE